MSSSFCSKEAMVVWRCARRSNQLLYLAPLVVQLIIVLVHLPPSSVHSFQVHVLPTANVKRYHHKTTTTIFRNDRRLQAAILSTAWEWIADARLASGDESYRNLSWIDPSSVKAKAGIVNIADDAQQASTYCWEDIPLYPLTEIHLAVPQVNYTLNNIEPRNIRMAQDLSSAAVANPTSKNSHLFCVVLRALDTGRLAQVGTLMRLLEAEPQYDPEDGTILRIVVTCTAIQSVTVDAILNGVEAEDPLERLKRSPVYLKATVSSREELSGTSREGKKWNQTCVDQLIRDYDFVRSMYIDGDAINEVPHFARADLEMGLPTLPAIVDDATFWTAAYTWQKLCNTVREGRQINIASDRNELMIDAALQKGGPLKLPIHPEELSPETQRSLREMEVEGLNEFVLDCQMDPVLDFLLLLQTTALSERIRLLSKMVARERQRLYQLALFK